MLSEQRDPLGQPPEPEQKPKRQPEVEYVGAPTEYANAEEVPESISLLAKIFAGGAIAWGVVVGVVALLVTVCAICGACALLTLR